MAIHKGSEGVVKVGTDTIAQTLDWTLTQSSDAIEVTTLADTSRKYVGGKPTGSGSVTCHWDESDTTAQGAMTPSAELSLKVYPEGAATGAQFASFDAVITNIDYNSGGNDGMVGATFTYQVSGDVTWAQA